MANRSKSDNSEEAVSPEEAALGKCGIVMPISAIDGCDESHWGNVQSILNDAIKDSGYEPNLVSASDESGIIQKRIIQNLYENPIVVCDVSGKNPNVMFELGLRLAFDKPVIIVKDDKTTYSFDTAPIEHVSYPRDLRYHSVIEFKETLARKIEATVKAAKSGDHSTFLGHFGKFKIAKIETEEVSSQEFLFAQMAEIKEEIRRLRTVNPQDDIQSAKAYAFNISREILSGEEPEGLSARKLDEIYQFVHQNLERKYPRLPLDLTQRLARDAVFEKQNFSKMRAGRHDNRVS